MKIFKYLDNFMKSARTENGYGIFYGIMHAIELAKSMSDMQIKKYKKHGIVPAAFFIWLCKAGIVNESMGIPYGGASKQEFLKIFKQNYIQPSCGKVPANNSSSSSNSIKISKWDTIMLWSVNQSYLWEEAELYGNYKNRAT
jgi:hypothetical protein